MDLIYGKTKLFIIIIGVFIFFTLVSHPAVQKVTTPIGEALPSAGGSTKPSLGFPDASASWARADAGARAWVSESYGKLPLSFEANQGQTSDQVKFLSRGSGYSLYLTSTEAVLTLRKPQAQGEPAQSQKNVESLQAASHPEKTMGAVLRMKLLGANSAPQVSGLEELPGKVNYFIGNDPQKWRTGIPTYRKVAYGQVYPGIDLVYYGHQGQLEYDFVVTPGADPTAIRLALEGADRLETNPQGDLILHTMGGEVRLHKPLVYQEVNGAKQSIPAQYVLLDQARLPDGQEPHTSRPTPHRFGFQVAAYDRSKPLIIDPVLVYSTYLGGNSTDNSYSIAVDTAGNAYVTGIALSTNFPVASPYQAGNAGTYDAFVTKFNAAGSALIYSTYLGGSGFDRGNGIAVDTAGNAYVTGFTASTNFPTANPFQASKAGAGYDAFVTKLNATGSVLVYSTYLGGSDDDFGYGIAVDGSGNAYVTGYTFSTNFPTASPFQKSIGGSLSADAFVTKFNAAGSALIYSTYLGDNDEDRGFGIAVDGSGNAYVTGITASTNFPTANPFQASKAGAGYDAFVTKFNAAGSALVYSTYLGGSSDDHSNGIAVDTAGNAYVTGYTFSTNFPTANPFQATKAGTYDAFVTKFNATGSVLVSTYLGGSNDDRGFGIAVDGSGSAYVTGITYSTNFPTASPFQATNADTSNAFVTKVAALNQPPSADSVTPVNITTAAGVAQSFTVTYSDPDGFQDIVDAVFYIAGGGHDQWLHYLPGPNIFGLVGVTGFCTPGQAATLSTSFLTLNCSSSSVSGSGTRLTVTFNVTPQPSFAGTQYLLFIFVRDKLGASDGKIPGTWTVQ